MDYNSKSILAGCNIRHNTTAKLRGGSEIKQNGDFCARDCQFFDVQESSVVCKRHNLTLKYSKHECGERISVRACRDEWQKDWMDGRGKISWDDGKTWSILRHGQITGA